MTILRLADQTSNYSGGIPVVNGDVFAAPRDFAYAASNGKATSRSIQQQLNLSHKFAGNWSANVWLNHSTKNDEVGIYQRGGRSTSLSQIGRSFQSWNGPITGTAINAYVNGLLRTGSVEHQVVIGYDYGRNLQDYPTGFKYYFTEPVNGLVLDRQVFDTRGKTPDFYESFRERISRQTNAVYVQDNIKFSEKLKALIALRYDRIFNNSLGEFTKGETSYDTSATQAFIPRLGLVYQPTKNLTLYGSYAEGFEPQFSNSRVNGGPFPPETGKQWEFGVRNELMKGRLSTSVAWYQIIKTNVVNADPSDATGTRQIATGEVTSRGIEVSVTGQLTTRWNVIANFARNRIFTSKSADPAEVGVNFGDTPRDMANLWTTYAVGQHLKIGVGYRYNSERTTRGLTLPAYSVLDGLVSYTRRKINVALNAGNLFDTRYVLGTFNPNYTFQGAPRNVRVTVGYNF